MSHLYDRRILRFLFYSLCTLVVSAAAEAESSSVESPFDEALVFEWWDNGIVDADEAREILDLLEEGNVQEACILAEVYALEKCSEKTPEKKQRKKQNKATRAQRRRLDLAPHGFVEWRGRTDSVGHLESYRTELQLHFYRYTLRLGSQSLLTYKGDGAEAHLGEISTQELHSLIPLDTLWGAAGLYPVGIFGLGALLDTATNSRANVIIAPSPELELQLAYWHHRHRGTASERHSVFAQAKGSFGGVAAWWIPEKRTDIPLFKIQLRHREKMELGNFSWKADAYLHGDFLPQESHLSSTIEKSRFWGSQTAGVSLRDAWKSNLSINARTIIPLESDSSKTRFKAAAETGPAALRGGASATCLQAETHCRQNDLSLKASSTWPLGIDGFGKEHVTFAGKIRARHTRGEGFGAPLYEAGAAYAAGTFNRAGIALTIPKGNPARELRLRSSTEIGTESLQLSLAVTFRRTAETPLHPLRAALKARFIF